jgi:hypothetical protein
LVTVANVAGVAIGSAISILGIVLLARPQRVLDSMKRNVRTQFGSDLFQSADPWIIRIVGFFCVVLGSGMVIYGVLGRFG